MRCSKESVRRKRSPNELNFRRPRTFRGKYRPQIASDRRPPVPEGYGLGEMRPGGRTAGVRRRAVLECRPRPGRCSGRGRVRRFRRRPQEDGAGIGAAIDSEDVDLLRKVPGTPPEDQQVTAGPADGSDPARFPEGSHALRTPPSGGGRFFLLSSDASIVRSIIERM